MSAKYFKILFVIVMCGVFLLVDGVGAYAPKVTNVSDRCVQKVENAGGISNIYNMALFNVTSKGGGTSEQICIIINESDVLEYQATSPSHQSEDAINFSKLSEGLQELEVFGALGADYWSKMKTIKQFNGTWGWQNDELGSVGSVTPDLVDATSRLYFLSTGNNNQYALPIRYLFYEFSEDEASSHYLYFQGFYKQDVEGAINWEVVGNTEAPLGEEIRFTVKGTPEDGSSTADLACLNCIPEFTTFTVTPNNISIVMNTTLFLTKNPLIKQGNFNFGGTTDKGASDSFSVPWKILSFNCKDFDVDSCMDPVAGNPQMCFWWQEENTCQSRVETSFCTRLPERLCGPGNKIGSEKCVWNKAQEQCLNPVDAQISSEYAPPDGYTGALPPCAFSGTCRNINDILQLVVNFANGMFMILGAFSFAFFVFGGFMMIVSFGSADKIKTARDMMIAAVVGLVVAIVAGLLVDILLDVVGVSSEYRAFDL